VIHETAIIDPQAQLASDVSVGPYSVIGADVEIAAGTVIGPHVVIKGPTKIGCDNKIYQFASIGEDPQHLEYRGEPTRIEIGDRNIFREICTVNRGSTDSEGVTRVGHDNFLMSYTHVAHDCQVGNHVIFANNAGIAGHVVVDDHVVLGAFAGVHQFCRVGAYAFLGRATKIVKDIPPYMMVAGNPGVPCGLNAVGLKRQGFDSETLRRLREAFRILYRRGLKLDEACQALKPMAEDCQAVARLLSSIESSSRGIARAV
jgi:UDP-N-acetylglucosamine acyltransferase